MWEKFSVSVFFFSIRLNHHVALKVAFLGFLLQCGRMSWLSIKRWYDRLITTREKNKILPTVQKTAMLAFSKRRTNFYLYIQTTGRFPYIAVGRIFLQTHCYFMIVAVGVQNKGRGEQEGFKFGIQLKNICINSKHRFYRPTSSQMSTFNF